MTCYDYVVQPEKSRRHRSKKRIALSFFAPRPPLSHVAGSVVAWTVYFPATAVLAQEKPSTIVLEVDATTISRKILSARESFPVASPLAHTIDLVYPKWIPGNHAPTGPIADLVNLRFTADGKSVAWVRDPVDMFRFHIPVPAGTNLLVADYSLVGAYVAGNDFGPGNTSTPVQGDVNWDQLVLYPADTVADQVTVSASIKLPDKWSYATALPHPSPQGGSIHFDPVLAHHADRFAPDVWLHHARVRHHAQRGFAASSAGYL